MIPEEAIAAAAKEIDAPSEPAAQEIARRALEAAVPYMRRVVTTIDGLESLRGGAVVMDSDESILEKPHYDPRWWFEMGTSDRVSVGDITLPVTVLHEPTA